VVPVNHEHRGTMRALPDCQRVELPAIAKDAAELLDVRHVERDAPRRELPRIDAKCADRDCHDRR
jgi:hypothetical protein